MSLVPTRDEVPQLAPYVGVPGQPMAGPGARPASSGMTGRDVLQILRRHKWLILITLVAFTVASIIGTFVWRQVHPLYSAQALLAVNPPKTSTLSPTTIAPSRDVMDRYLLGEAQRISSEEVLNGVVSDPEVQSTDWYAKAQAKYQNGGSRVVEQLLEDLSISQVPQTNLLSVSIRTTNAEQSALIVTKVAQAAAKLSERSTRNTFSDSIRDMKGQLEALRAARNAAVAQINRAMSRGVGTENVEAADTLRAKLNVLTRMGSELEMAYISAYQQLQALGVPDEQLANDPMVKMELDANMELSILRQRLLAAQLEVDSLERRVGEGSRQLGMAKDALDSAKARYDAVLAEETAKAIEKVRSSAEMNVQTIGASLKSIRSQIASLNANLTAVEQNKNTLITAQDDKRLAETKMQSLEMRLIDLEMLQKSEQPVTLHRGAMVPTSPSMPRYPVMVPIGVLLGLVVGLGLAFLLEFMDTSIKAPSDVSRKVDLPLLGMIPHLDDVEDSIADIRTAFQTNPHTIVGEQFRQIRTMLMFTGLAEERRSLLVTSPMPEDGRSTVALNLGHAIADGGRKVLVIDANFRQPVIRTLFRDCPEGGLSSALVGQDDWRGLVREVEPNLFVMAAGPTPPNPAELLGSDRMRQLLEEMTGEYDQVIFDGAPCLVVSDSVVLSTKVDGTVLVVRAGENSYGAVQRARDIISRLGSNIFGVVLNGVRARSGGYLRKNYETYYEYRGSQQLPAGKSES